MGSKKKKSSRHGKNSDPKGGTCVDCCQICGRLVLFVASILAVVFSLLVVASCDFIEFVATPTNSTDATPIEFSFGQFRYQANNSGCLKIDDNDINIDWTFWTGRVSTAIALICAGVACLIILVEFICCRFKFSRCALSTLFSIAILGMALAFLMFASNVCTSENAEGRRYPCTAGTGSWYAVVSIGLYFVTSITSCFAPRPKPMIRRLNDEDDPCLCCGGKKHDEEEESSKKKDEEQPPEPTTPTEPPPPPVVEEPPPPVTPVVVAAATGAAVAATQTSPQQQAPMSQIVTTSEDDASQVSSIVYPSNISAVTMPVTAFPTVSIYDNDLFFDAGDGANSV